MNDLSFALSDDPERDRAIVDLVIAGKRVDDVARVMGCTLADVNHSLDRAAAAYLTPQARVRSIFVDAMRLERATEAVAAAAAAGDDKAINSLTKLSERRGVLLGLSAPQHLRVDPVQLALEASPRLTSTEHLRAVFMEMRAAMGEREAEPEKVVGE